MVVEESVASGLSSTKGGPVFLLYLNGAGISGQAGFGFPLTWDNYVNHGGVNSLALVSAAITFSTPADTFVRNRPVVLGQAVTRAGFY